MDSGKRNFYFRRLFLESKSFRETAATDGRKTVRNLASVAYGLATRWTIMMDPVAYGRFVGPPPP
eukprot:6567621-Prymnesium_polylepis.1